LGGRFRRIMVGYKQAWEALKSNDTVFLIGPAN
jgi:hypothetical protein